MSSDIQAFFTLHRDLPREGPGEAADVAWAAALVGLKDTAKMADVACGPGGDIAALLKAVPQGHVTALDKTAHFVQQARAVWSGDERTTILKADMAAIANTYDFIWCAGAVYFLGIEPALKSWRKSLRPGGVIAFSEPCWFTDAPSQGARLPWADYPAMTNADGIATQIDAAGYEVLGTRKLADQAWENYFTPIDQRIESVRAGADGPLTQVLDEAAAEAASWRRHRGESGYLLTVVRPR
ncbi:MAG: class I SAM-dependent methyltransferase [Sulfitobacter sp.]